MNKWHELRMWLRDVGEVSVEDILQKMTDLDKEADHLIEVDNELFLEITDEDVERWDDYQKKQRQKHPWFFELLDKVTEGKVNNK